MAAERPESAIRSEREDDPELEGRIESFVLALGETVDAMQDAEAGGDLAQLTRLVLRFAVEALELGYPQLEQSARRIGDAIVEGNPESVHKAVGDITEVALRARRGHRSAAT